MENNDIKEKILREEVLKVTNGMLFEHNVTHKGILNAMEIYAEIMVNFELQKDGKHTRE